MGIKEIGCCGAYCKTCRSFLKGICPGCKAGYASGKRNLNRAKCRVKVCCIKKGWETCADCGIFISCPKIENSYNKKVKKNKCREAIEFIKKNGYDCFIRIAGKWKNNYGELE